MDAPDHTRDNNLQAKDMQKRKRAWKPSALPQTHTTLTTIMRITIDFLFFKFLALFGPKGVVLWGLFWGWGGGRSWGKHWHLVVRKQKWIYPVWQIPLKVAFEAEKQCYCSQCATTAVSVGCRWAASMLHRKTFLSFVTMYFLTLSFNQVFV